MSKMRNVLIGLTILSTLIFGIGSGKAVLGQRDGKVDGNDPPREANKPDAIPRLGKFSDLNQDDVDIALQVSDRMAHVEMLAMDAYFLKHDLQRNRQAISDLEIKSSSSTEVLTVREEDARKERVEKQVENLRKQINGLSQRYDEKIRQLAKAKVELHIVNRNNGLPHIAIGASSSLDDRLDTIEQRLQKLTAIATSR